MAREMKEHELASPVDLPARPISGRYPLLWTSVTIATAALILFFANAGTLAAWVDEKPVSEVQLHASDAARQWKAVMDGHGITAPREAAHAAWKQLQAARFGDEAPAETQ